MQYNFRIALLLQVTMLSIYSTRSAVAFLNASKSCRSVSHQRLVVSRCYSTRRTDLITSTKAATVKEIQALLKKRKRRNELERTVVEGPRMVFDLLDNPKTRPLVQRVVVSVDRPEWSERLMADYGDLLIYEATAEVMNAMSDTVTPQGLVATISMPPLPQTTEAPTTGNRNAPMYLLLDGVSDPGNVGTLLRSSLAVGVSAVVLLPGCCDVWNPKAVRSAMGSTFQIPILDVSSLQEAQTVMANWGVGDIYAATMETSGGSESVQHYDVPWSSGKASALMVGSEGNGLSDEVRQAVASGYIKAIHVPMEVGIESLNAAVCGSVILFEYHRQCRTATV
jgi:TrmH family RNA methyltransferase